MLTRYLLEVTKISKRHFIIETGKEQIPVEGYEHKNVAIKYLMKRRRSLLSTKAPEKIDKLFEELPKEIVIRGAQIIKTFKITWERVGKTEFEGSRFIFTIKEV